MRKAGKGKAGTGRAFPLLLAAAGLLAGGCTVSNIQGPQLTDPPEGFGYTADARSKQPTSISA